MPASRLCPPFLSSIRIEGDSLAVSDDGAVAFIAGNGDAERTALYIRDSGGTLHHVFSEGDTVSAPGLPSFQIPYQSFNPSSIGPVFASSEGHFVVTAAGRVLAVSVPEPAGLALLAFTVALLAGTGKRHRRCAP